MLARVGASGAAGALTPLALLLILAVAAIGLGGCERSAEAPVPPDAYAVVGKIEEKRGWCHWIAGDDGKRYALHFGQLGELPQGARVRIVAKTAKVQDCPGAIALEPVQAPKPAR